MKGIYKDELQEVKTEGKDRKKKERNKNQTFWSTDLVLMME